MKCKECKSFRSIGNTEETGQGLCAYGTSYQPTTVDTDCPMIREHYYCKDCEHFIEQDTACFTANADDIADTCPGFTDERFWEVVSYLLELRANGKDYKEEMKRIINEVESSTIPERK